MTVKNCKDFCDRFSDFLDGELGPEECHLIEEHLAECSSCSVIYKSFKTTVDVSKRALTDEVSEEVRDRLKSFLRQRCRDQHFHP